MNVQYAALSILFAHLFIRHFHQHARVYHQVDNLRPNKWNLMSKI